MKRIYIYFLLFLLIASFMLSVTGCDLAGVSIDARIDSFIHDLNYDRTNVYTNFHYPETSDYNSLKNVSLTIDPVFPTSGIPYSRGTLNTADPSYVTGVISGGGGWGSKNAVFVMLKDDVTWYIEELHLNGSPVWQ